MVVLGLAILAPMTSLLAAVDAAAAERTQALAQKTVQKASPKTSGRTRGQDSAKTNNKKPAAKAKNETGKKAVPEAVQDADAAKAATPSGDDEKAEKKTPGPLTSWDDKLVTAELARCRKILSKINAVAIPLSGFRNNSCGAPAPIQLISVGKSPEVVFSPPARVTCELAGALHKWLTGDLQKLAQTHLGEKVIRVEVMSDYACRNAYGRKSGRLSEHALVNALDIRGFVTASGRNARVLKSWGQTRRDVAAAIAAAKKAHEEAEAKRQQAQAASSASREPARKANVQRLATNEKRTASGAVNRSQLGKPVAAPRKGSAKLAMVNGERRILGAIDESGRAANGSKPETAKAFVPPPRKPLSKTGLFLRSAHISACNIFGTVLGPEANDAHRNHFHVDMAPRKRSNFCE